jgi:hypothetical protein
MFLRDHFLILDPTWASGMPNFFLSLLLWSLYKNPGSGFFLSGSRRVQEAPDPPHWVKFYDEKRWRVLTARFNLASCGQTRHLSEIISKFRLQLIIFVPYWDFLHFRIVQRVCVQERASLIQVTTEFYNFGAINLWWNNLPSFAVSTGDAVQWWPNSLDVWSLRKIAQILEFLYGVLKICSFLGKWWACSARKLHN